MRNILVLVVAIISLTLTGQNSVEPTVDLKTALENEQVEVTITGNPDSPHYVKPVLVSVKNLSDNRLTVKIPNGLQLHSPDVQDVIVTKEEMITLAPKAETKRAVYGMCTQEMLSASNEESLFTVGEVSSGNLAALAAEIERSKNFNTLGQYAIWTLTDDDDLNMISGFDMKEATRLKTFVADLLNVPVPEYDADDYLTNYVDDGLIQRAITSRFKFRSIDKARVSIAMFDDEDRIVRELFNDPNVPRGDHTMEIKFDAEVYTNKTYFIRMIVDDEIKINMKMEPRQG